jgi:hypothetical protein
LVSELAKPITPHGTSRPLPLSSKSLITIIGPSAGQDLQPSSPSSGAFSPLETPKNEVYPVNSKKGIRCKTIPVASAGGLGDIERTKEEVTSYEHRDQESRYPRIPNPSQFDGHVWTADL